jgi:hypothetical protein
VRARAESLLDALANLVEIYAYRLQRRGVGTYRWTHLEDLGHRSSRSIAIDPKPPEDFNRRALVLGEESQQEVLGTDVVVPQRASLDLSEDDYLAGRLCEVV